VFLTLNDALKDAMKRQVELGLFDTQRLKRYRNGTDLATIPFTLVSLLPF
jgi:hypothetical protein